MPWKLVKDEATINAFADEIGTAPRQLFGGGTSISGIIDYAMPMFANAPFHGARQVIDISGDGRTLAVAGSDGTVKLWDLPRQPDL